MIELTPALAFSQAAALSQATALSPAAALSKASVLTQAPAIFDTLHGVGPAHTLCLPGLVPDGPETFIRQRLLLRSLGRSEVITYRKDCFDLDALIDACDHRLREVHAAGRRPVLLGVSVGGGIALELLRRAREAGRPLPLSAVVLISPLTCTGDLAPLLKRVLDPILTGDDPALAIERGRSLFRSLARGSAGENAEVPWTRLLTPSGWVAHQEQRLRERIEASIAAIGTRGALDRCQALTRFVGVDGPGKGPLATCPTMVLWGSRERHTLRMDGPGTSLLCRPDLAARLFPTCEVHWTYGQDGEEVPHASLIRHAHAFNPHIARFLRRNLVSGQVTRA